MAVTNRTATRVEPLLDRRGSAWGWAKHSWPSLAFVCAVVAAAVAITLIFSPVVSVQEIQRRDRLTPAAQFVQSTYRYFLGRAADQAGLVEYEPRYERDGPTAVALAIIASREFRDRYSDGRPIPGSDPGATGLSDPATIANRYVQLYQAGSLQQSHPVDVPGRIGFVLLLAITSAAVLIFHRGSRAPLVGTALHAYLPKWFVVGLFSALAVTWWLNSQLLFFAFAPGSIDYAEWLNKVTNLSIARGIGNIWTPYPQGTQLALVVIETLASTVSAWLNSDIWTSYTIFRCVFQAVFLVVPSAILVSIVYDAGILLSPASATFGATVVALSFAPLYYGLVSSVVTDPLPVALAILAVLLWIRHRIAWAAVVLALGVAIKLIPAVLIVPFLVLAHSNRSRARLMLISGILIGLAFLPFLVSNADVFWSPFRWQSSRPPWQSWYAFVGWLLGAPHEYGQPAFEDIGFRHDFGWVFWGITPSLSAMTLPVTAGDGRWQNVVSVVGAGLCLLGTLSAKSSSPRAIIRWSMYALAVTFIWSVGWSPQYELYLIPLVALSFEAPFVVVGSVVALGLLTFLEYPLLLPWAYFYGGSAVWLAWGSTLARYLLLGWFALFVLRTEGSLDAFLNRLRVVRGFRMLPALGSAVLLLLGAGCAQPTPPPTITSTPTSVPSAHESAPPVGAQPTTGGAAAAPVVRDSCGAPRGRVPSAPDNSSASDLDWPVPAGHFFSQAGEPMHTGYSVFDDDKGRFWSEFQRLGGWGTVGYPASRRFNWHGTLAQATQRAVLQWSPVTGEVEFANVLDLLHEQGLDESLLSSKQIPPPADVDEVGLPYETIAARRLQWLDARPAIRAKYCDAPGGADPVALWGLPTSMAVNVGQPGEVYVLRTQRAAFQEWVEGASWAAPGEVTVVLAGDLAKDFRLIPADAMLPELAPARN